jgi:hypothetical protein
VVTEDRPKAWTAGQIGVERGACGGGLRSSEFRVYSSGKGHLLSGRSILSHGAANLRAPFPCKFFVPRVPGASYPEALSQGGGGAGASSEVLAQDGSISPRARSIVCIGGDLSAVARGILSRSRLDRAQGVRTCGLCSGATYPNGQPGASYYTGPPIPGVHAPRRAIQGAAFWHMHCPHLGGSLGS